MDGQALGLPYPQALTDVSAWYATTMKDPHFLGENFELWFQSYIAVELLFQLPYFCVASYYMLYYYKSSSSYPAWFRVLSIIYATQAITAMIPVLAVVWFNDNAATLTERIILCSVYLPYLLVPLWLLRILLLNDDYTLQGSGRTIPTSIIQGKVAFLVFFYSHIPITILIDSQAVMPAVLHPKPLLDLTLWYATTLGDHLMMPPFAKWFQCMVACEVTLQFPFFWIALAQLTSRRDYYAAWFPSLALVYGVHVCTTMIPIYTELLVQDNTTGYKWLVCAIYAPYAVFPACMAYWAATTMLKNDKNKKQE